MPKILIVDDDPHIREVLRFALDKAGYRVCEAADGAAAMTQVERERPDLIVLDILMPEMDGTEVCRRLRRHSSTPIIFLSSKDDEIDRILGLELGGDDYLTKPFAFAELLARVRALVRRSEQDRGAEIRFADLRLDPVTHKVWRKDKEIDLTAKEYSLLEYFMRNPNQVLTRTMIAEHVWDYTFDSFTNIIDVYVNYLRKKIDREADKKLIHTVRGVGYILKEEE